MLRLNLAIHGWRDLIESPQASPVFIVGPPRSGSTLLLQVLEKCLGYRFPAETHYFDQLRPSLVAPSRDGGKSERSAVEEYFRSLHPHGYGPRDLNVHDPVRWQAMAEMVDACDEPSGDKWFEAHCRFASGGIGPAMLWGEKTPRHVFRIDEMVEAFPNARFIVMIRHPRSVVASYVGWHASRIAASDVPTDEALRVQMTSDPLVISMLWRAAAKAAARAVERHGGTVVEIVRFEDLVSRPEDSVAALGEWLGLEPALERLADLSLVNSSFGRDGAEVGLVSNRIHGTANLLPRRSGRVVDAVTRNIAGRFGYPVAGSVIGSRLRVMGEMFLRAPVILRAGLANRDRMNGIFDYVRRRV